MVLLSAGRGAYAESDPPVAVSASERPTTFAVVVLPGPGERLDLIARRHGTTQRRILALNPGVEPRRVVPGEALVAPARWDALPEAPPLAHELCRGARGHKRVALTFDCAWVRPRDLDALLSALERHSVCAAFFVTGVFLRQHPDAPNRLSRAGHRVHNHSWSHPYFTRLSDETMRTELLRVEERVAATAALTTRPYWRAPYGERNGEVLRVAADLGFRSVRWTIDSLDWATPPPSPEQVFERVCRRPFERASSDPDPLDGAIVLFHAGAPPTPQALDLIIPWLRDNGYRVVELDEMLRP